MRRKKRRWRNGGCTEEVLGKPENKCKERGEGKPSRMGRGSGKKERGKEGVGKREGDNKEEKWGKRGIAADGRREYSRSHPRG